MERTLIVLKPDAVQRRLVGRIIERFERKGLRLVGVKMLRMDEERARRMYSAHEGQHFYEPLMAFVTSSPVVAMVLRGPQAISVARSLIGTTDGREAAAGTIRGDWGLSPRHNLVHGSDSAESAQQEIPIFFEPQELLDYGMDDMKWVSPT